MTDTMGAAEWDARYREKAGAAWSREPNTWIAETVGAFVPGHAIDLGAGEGRNALWLSSIGWTVTAVDFSAEGLAVGRRRAEEDALVVEWVQADVSEWQPERPADLVLLSYLQLEAGVLEPLLGRAAGWLESGGRLVVIAHDRENLERGVGGPQTPEVLATEESLRRGAADLIVEHAGQHLRTVAGADRPAIDTVLVARRL